MGLGGGGIFGADMHIILLSEVGVEDVLVLLFVNRSQESDDRALAIVVVKLPRWCSRPEVALRICLFDGFKQT